MALLENNAEGMAPGTVVTTAQTGSGTAFNISSVTGTATATYSNTRSAHGTQSYHMVGEASGGAVAFGWNGNGSTPTSSTQAAYRFYVYFETLPSGVMSIARLIDLTSVRIAEVAFVSGKLIVQDKNGTITTFPTSITTSQWYRIEVQAIVGASEGTSTVSAAYYLLDSTTPVDAAFSTSTAVTGTANAYNLVVGKNSSTPSVDMYVDDIAFNIGSSSQIGVYVPPSNAVPVANAGLDQADIEPWTTVTLDGSGSTDSDGTITSYAWTQDAGTTVTLSSASVVSPTFTAPASIAGETLTFRLVATDNQGSSSAPDTVDITILPVTERAVVGGQEVTMKLEAVEQ